MTTFALIHLKIGTSIKQGFMSLLVPMEDE